LRAIRIAIDRHGHAVSRIGVGRIVRRHYWFGIGSVSVALFRAGHVGLSQQMAGGRLSVQFQIRHSSAGNCKRAVGCSRIQPANGRCPTRSTAWQRV
jgi:hypothetical protein